MNNSKQTSPAIARRVESDQRGMAALVITMVTMVVISLIVIGFATVSRREQRQAVDQLLSSQAFYAAESGVEDVRNAIRNFQVTDPGVAIPSKTNCRTNNAGVNIYPTAGAMVVDSAFDVAYTCLKVSSAPGTVQFDGLDEDSVVVPITTAQPITSLVITWKPTTAPAGSPNVCPSVPTAANRVFSPQSGANAWRCGYGIMRTDVVPTNNGGAVTTGGLGSGQLSAFFVPTNPAGSGNLAYNGNTGEANVVAADCNTPAGAYGECSATITNLTGNTRALSLRLSSLYQASDVTVEAFNGGNPQGIIGAQVEVDVTGRASDVLRRIKVRIPIGRTGSVVTGNAISTSGSICKRFSANAGYFNIPGDIVDVDGGNRMCQAQTDEN